MDKSNYVPICDKNEVIYTACYCEENIWKLLEYCIRDKGNIEDDELYAVFISNRNKTIPVWYQKNCNNIETPVIWDYHVIALHRSKNLKSSYVYDLDTLLNFPEIFENYYQKALPVLTNIKKEFQRMYRVIPANYYLENFASDRSHMVNFKTGEYNSPPPNYSCIECKTSRNNINEFINMDKNEHGTIMSEKEFQNFFFRI